MFRYATAVRLPDTDAAGVIFFAQQLRMAHEAGEAFMEAAGYALHTTLSKAGILLPIVRAESDYLAPLHWGDALSVEVRCGRIGTTSFTLRYRFRKDDGALVGTARIVHVAVSSKTGRPVRLPVALRTALTTAAARNE